MGSVWTVLAAEHVEGDGSQLLGVGTDPEPGGQFQGPRTIDPAGQDSWQAAKQATAVRQVDADSTEVHLGGTDVLFVDANRGVRGDQADIGPGVDQ